MQVIQRSRIATAKGEISQLAALLEMVKQDTGSYPVFLTDIASKDPPPEQIQGWQGPYISTPIPLDPWGHPYFYQIPPTTLFNSPSLPRKSGEPEEDTYFFSGLPAQATLEIENYGVTSADIYLNETEVVSPDEFKKNPQPQIIKITVNILNGENTVFTKIASAPGAYLYISISGFMPTSQYFILGSYGNDGQPGGTGFNADIIWKSDVYPNFLKPQ